MKLHRIASLTALCALFFISIPKISSAQIGGINALVKGSVSNTSGAPAEGVTITAYKGTEQVRTTKSTPEGKFTLVLKPGTVYRLSFVSAKYYFHEEPLSIQQSDKYLEVPVQVSLKELELGRPYSFSDLVFEPKSSNISPNVMADFENIASAMKHNPKLTVTGTVYPDETPAGKKASAQNSLAASRRTALIAFFSSKNIPASNISIEVSTNVPGNGAFERTATAEQPATKGKKKKKGAATTVSTKKIMVPQYAQIIMQVPS
ncbi:MAG: carboxypeptidase-like regulatory domain-containing protein [Bacteroidota bacterium]|nr:carboxypeptidase-like regulatory domain-containing protein [Bacteroidota bacterium]MDP4229442.1 carboxypeptidase-like regulatory domain-containing protein [Bacteroidota bacterium]MDP4235393.1 carboxypeptidase-like regulatory domain-containing protein [Bacteroidota bacterium]